MNRGVLLEEVFQSAERRSLEVEVPDSQREAMREQLRVDSLAFFERLHEPPLYRRAEDPLRALAEAQMAEADFLLARWLGLVRAGVVEAEHPLGRALRAHLETLFHSRAGRLARAEESWLRASDAQREAAGSLRLWSRSDERTRPVFERATGASRYDPQPAPVVQVQLVCAQPGCRAAGDYSFAPQHSTYRFECIRCRSPFLSYFGEVQSTHVDAPSTGPRHYRFTLQEMTGTLSRIQFDEPSRAEFSAARGDLLAFLYNESRELRSVLNLSTRRLLWIQRGGCFLATVSFGEGAVELEAFRAYRDRVLLNTVWGRLFVRAYYRLGPALARRIAAAPLARTALRALLSWVHRRLVWSGYP